MKEEKEEEEEAEAEHKLTPLPTRRPKVFNSNTVYFETVPKNIYDEIVEFWGLDFKNKFQRENFQIRVMENQTSKDELVEEPNKIYLMSNEVIRFFDENARKTQNSNSSGYHLVNAGLSCFEKHRIGKEGKKAYRIGNDGALCLFPFVGKRVVKITIADLKHVYDTWNVWVETNKK